MSKKRVSMTEFAKAILQTGSGKNSSYRAIKAQGPYDVKTDYYKRIRESMISVASGRMSFSNLYDLIDAVPKKKKKGYEETIDALNSWYSSFGGEFFSPHRTVLQSDYFDVSVNPEIGIKLDGKVYVVKMYFKKPAISCDVMNCMGNAMKMALDEYYECGIMCVLDVRRCSMWKVDRLDETMVDRINNGMEELSSQWRRL